MKIKIEYESDRLLPKEISDKIDEVERRVQSNPHERDKVFLNIDGLKGFLIKWISDNSKVIKEEK